MFFFFYLKNADQFKNIIQLLQLWKVFNFIIKQKPKTYSFKKYYFEKLTKKKTEKSFKSAKDTYFEFTHKSIQIIK